MKEASDPEKLCSSVPGSIFFIFFVFFIFLDFFIFFLFALDIVCRINLIETAATQIVRDNHVCDCVEHELNVICVGGTGHVAVNLLCSRLVLCLKLRLDVSGRLTVLLCAWKCQTIYFAIYFGGILKLKYFKNDEISNYTKIISYLQ